MMLPPLHDVTISRYGFPTIDGVPLWIDKDFTIEHLDLGISRLSCTIICKSVVLGGDNHQLPLNTPIYDEMREKLISNHKEDE